MNSGISYFLRNRYAFLNKVQPDSLSIFWIFNKEGSRLNLNQWFFRKMSKNPWNGVMSQKKSWRTE